MKPFTDSTGHAVMFSAHNRVPVVLNPEYEYRFRNLEPRRHIPPFMVMMPNVELYFHSLKAAINYTKDSRRIHGQRRRGYRKVGF